MVYVTSGMGIVPIVHQIKTVLLTRSSSVKMVTVVWINDDSRDFDIFFRELEEEYFKYNTKLEVSCVVMNEEGEVVTTYSFDENEEINHTVPNFRPGTMAVISGPEEFVQEASKYL
jgi:hypothetical protein